MYNIKELINKLRSIKLLYVEDNEDARDSTLLLFEDIFNHITVAVDGKDGLEKFNRGEFDLIITDVSMPIMDGIDMSSEIRKTDKDVSIIILTALKDINTVIRAIDISVDCFINKPLEDIDVLFNKLDTIVQKIELKKILIEKEQIKVDKEKIDLILKLLGLIEHHWRQPLSVISTISSGCTIAKEVGDRFTQEDLENANIITETTQDISNLLERIKKIDFKNSTINEIEDIISISNEIYKG